MTNDYYERYWDAANNQASGWTPSEGIVTPEEKSLFDRWLPTGSVCLDYGCGDGFRYGLKLRTKGVDYHGFDISETALKQAQERGLDVQALSPDGGTTLKSDTADVAICFEVLEHLIEPQQAVSELRRCLKPGGHALISVPNAAFWTARVEFLLTGFFCPGGSPITGRSSPWSDPHIRFYHPPMLRKLMQSCDLEVVQEMGERFTLGAIPYFWKIDPVRKVLDTISKPIAWLGRVFPGLFAARIFIVVRKPSA